MYGNPLGPVICDFLYIHFSTPHSSKEECTVFFLNVQWCDPALWFLPSFKDPELHHFTVTVTKANPNQFYFFGKYKAVGTQTSYSVLQVR